MNIQVDTTGMKVALNALAEAAEEFQHATYALMRGNPRNPNSTTRNQQARYQNADKNLSELIATFRHM